MPANTPIYGFTYPCSNDPISATDFQTLADQIDATLSAIQLDENYALGRYSSITTAANQAGIASGVETALTNAGSSYVVLADGVYWVNARAGISISAGDLSSARVRVRLNGVTQFGKTANEDATNSILDQINPMGMLSAVAGDTISMAILYFGTGPGTAVTQQMQVRQVVRIF